MLFVCVEQNAYRPWLVKRKMYSWKNWNRYNSEKRDTVSELVSERVCVRMFRFRETDHWA